MSSWISEAEFRSGGARQLGLGLNPAFFQDIKVDSVEFRELLDRVAGEIVPDSNYTARQISERLSLLRDALESYFALEEFYGFLPSKQNAAPEVSTIAERLREQHRSLFLQLCQVIEMTEQMVYHETKTDLKSVVESFQSFLQQLRQHELDEMTLLQRSMNEVLGGSE